jgi:hypothetical protein
MAFRLGQQDADVSLVDAWLIHILCPRKGLTSMTDQNMAEEEQTVDMPEAAATVGDNNSDSELIAADSDPGPIEMAVIMRNLESAPRHTVSDRNRRLSEIKRDNAD